ncbi:MAG: IS110 family transposase [Pseudomonadales bacterium]|nr:IS110 family transposase [Pseudomonadales bacterium]
MNRYKAYVGLDWADTKHDVCVQGADNPAREFDCIPHRVDKVNEWILALHDRFGGPIAVMLELTRGPIVYALQKYDFLDIIPVSPTALAKYRKFLHPSGSKNDPIDAELALDVVLRHPDQFQLLKTQSARLRELQLLVEHRRQLVSDRVRLTNRLCAILKQYYPQALEWFEHRDSALFCDFIDRWPSLLKVQRARTTTLLRFFRDHHSYRMCTNERRIEGIRSAQPLTRDRAIITAYSMQALVTVEQLRSILGAITRYDAAIAKIAGNHPDYELYAALPGAGATLAPRLLVAFGDQRERFRNASELQMYAGIAPVLVESGNKRWVHWRTQCPKFLRQTFVEWASHSIGHSYWAEAYYRQQREKGNTHQSAVRALAFKWIRILYRCWQTRTPYDESKYLKSLERRGSPLVRAAAAVS